MSGLVQLGPSFTSFPDRVYDSRFARESDEIVMQAGYLTTAIDKTAVTVGTAVDYLAALDFDTIIGIGLSGALIVPLLARTMNKKFALVRKDSERKGSHSGREMEGRIGRRWVFVDDQIFSGATFCKVIDTVRSVCAANDNFKTTLIATYTWLNPVELVVGDESKSRGFYWNAPGYTGGTR